MFGAARRPVSPKFSKIFKIPCLLFAIAVWYNFGVLWETAWQFDLFHTPGHSTARDRRHAEAESAKGGWQHPPAYAILRIWPYTKIASFLTIGRICEMRCVCKSHVACLPFVFMVRRLAMPRIDHELTGTPRSYFAPTRRSNV